MIEAPKIGQRVRLVKEVKVDQPPYDKVILRPNEIGVVCSDPHPNDEMIGVDFEGYGIVFFHADELEPA